MGSEWPSEIDPDKKEELENSGVKDLGETLARKIIMWAEITLHCKRRTRGAGKIKQLIDSLMKEYSGKTDMLGYPLFDGNEMKKTWEKQQKYLECNQDQD